MNEEEIIDVLENVFIFKNTNDRFTKLDLDAINGLLKLYKQEKEKNKKLEEEKRQAFKDYNSTAGELMDVINLMAEELSSLKAVYDFNCFIPDKYSNIDDCINKADKNISCSQCIKEYYFNKVKEEKL